jgi:hypothetical protein
MFHIIRVERPSSTTIHCGLNRPSRELLEWHERQRGRVLQSLLVRPAPAHSERRDA